MSRKFMKLMSSPTCHLRFSIYVVEFLKCDGQCSQYLELNPTCMDLAPFDSNETSTVGSRHLPLFNIKNLQTNQFILQLFDVSMVEKDTTNVSCTFLTFLQTISVRETRVLFLDLIFYLS